MDLAGRVLVSLVPTILLASTALAATITGNVQGPDGKPFMGAFVVVENTRPVERARPLSHRQPAGRDLHGTNPCHWP
jgi:hypothetical protein